MSRDHIRVIDDYRHCHENEFFFTYDPRKTSGTKQLMEYLENNFADQDNINKKVVNA